MVDVQFKTQRPTTPSQRGLKLLQRSFIWRKKPLKSKTVGYQRKQGRNNSGHTTAFHRGGGHKKRFRLIDFDRKTTTGIVEGIEHDPFRNALLGRVYNPELKTHSYILAPKNLFVGSWIKSGEDAEIRLGHSLPLSKIPVGSLIHNLSTSPFKIGQISRAAGTYSQLIQKTKTYARVRISSGEQRLVSLQAYATLGMVSNENLKLTSLGKAGRSRWKNWRPHVRGVAMNPVDHPHGGGEGKTSGGRPSVTPWGKPTKGPKTSRSRNSMVVVRRSSK